MANTPAVDLSYGHFGTPLYDPETKQWLFQRRLRTKLLLKSLIWSKAMGSTNNQQPNPQILKTVEMSCLKRNIHALTRNNPEVAPAVELLPELSRVSASVVSTVSNYDPTVGDLVAFGRDVDGGDGGRGRHRIVASPCGETGNILRMMYIHEDRLGWGVDKGVWLNVPCMHAEFGISGWWAGDCASIRQICSSDSDSRGSYMAVRMPTQSVFFRPRYDASPAEKFTSQRYRLPRSTLDPHPIMHIPITQTGGSPHADVAFNPWYRRQIALVDEGGSWSIWELQGQHLRHGLQNVSCLCMGTIVPLKSENPISDSQENMGAPEDGWARVTWIGNVNIIVVCNRRHMSIIDISGGQKNATSLKCPDFGLAGTASWILDIRRIKHDLKRFLVLTSTMLYLLQVNSFNGTFDANSQISVLLSWRHFRGAEDVTLQIQPCNEGLEETSIFMFSRLNALVTVFQYSQLVTEPPLPPVSSLCPTQLELPLDLLRVLEFDRRIRSLFAESIPYGENINESGDGPGRQYIGNDNIRFYSITIVLDDYSVHEVVAHSLKAMDDAEAGFAVKVPSWRTRDISMRHLRYKTSQYANHISDFVVPDGKFRDPGNMSKRVGGPFIDHPKTGSILPRPLEWTEDDPWSINNQSMYDRLRDLGLSPDESGEDVVSLLQRIKGELDKDDALQPKPFGTLFDFVQLPVQVADIDEVSSHFGEFLRSPLRDAESELPQLDIHISSWLWKKETHHPPDQFSIASVYDELLRTFIAPLPRHIPPRLRQVKERLARLVAAELSLASSMIRVLAPPQPTLEESHSEARETIGFTLPVRSSRAGKERVSEPPGLNTHSSSRNLISSLPTPETTPSLASGSSFTSSSSSFGENPYTRLKQHLHVTKVQRYSHFEHSAGDQILTHWKQHFGQDPAEYDWEATSRAIQDNLPAKADDDMSATQRARIQRKAERHLKRQRRETAATEAASNLQPFATTESLPFLTTEMTPLRSSPGPIRYEKSQTRHASSQPVIVSQVERGVFGGRPDSKRKKKKGTQVKLPGFR